MINFDNLVEDAEKHGAQVSDSFSLHLVNDVGILFYEDELKNLITQYILADRAQGQEPVGWYDPSNKAPGQSVTFDKTRHEKWAHLFPAPLFTHAQPTPAQIVEKEEARNWRRWKEAQDYVAKELPEGFRIVMNMAQDDWYISLYDIDDKDVEFDSGDNSSHAITNAVNVAISMNKGEPL